MASVQRHPCPTQRTKDRIQQRQIHRPQSIRSSPSLKATAPAAISGKPPSACSTPLSKRHITASAPLPGTKSSPARRRKQNSRTGSLTTPSAPSANFALPQRPADHTRRRRHSLPQRRPAPDPRSLRLRPPVKYYAGVPSPVKHPERMNIVIFRENTEDVYMGVEWEQGTPSAPS